MLLESGMRDPLDKKTMDFADSEIPVSCGHVLMDRHRHIAIVTKRTPKFAQLVRVQANTLRISNITSKQLITEWVNADYPFEDAVARLLELGKKHGITEHARKALESLAANRKKPFQFSLFDY